jgi:hemerythrin
MDKGHLLEWDERYSVGIELIDEQHRELASQINNICLGCHKGGREAKIFFDSNIHRLLRYMRYHFSSEEKLLERIKYPDLSTHSQQHSEMINLLAEEIGRIERENISVLLSENRLPAFASYLRDMLVSHIAVLDKKYVSYIHFVNHRMGTYIMEPSLPTELFIG